MNLQMTTTCATPKGVAGEGEKEYRRQQERAGVIRKTDDGNSAIVPIASREMLAGEMRKANL